MSDARMPGGSVTDPKATNGDVVARNPTGKFACVVDAPARFHLDALRWYAALSRVTGVASSDLIVHAVSGCRSDVLDYLRKQGVTVRDVEPFDVRSPHCNKISGALDLAATGVDGLAVLTDADVVVLEDPRGLEISNRAVGLKAVDAAKPSLTVLEAVFDAAGLPLPPLWPVDLGPTVAGNGNGGFYLVPGEVLSIVTSAWERWARWLLDRVDLLERWVKNVDQVAMAMALAAEGIEAHRLDPRWNLPTHRPDRIHEPLDAPAAIHYHKHVNKTGLLSPTGFDTIDSRIDIANAAISEIWHEAFPNATFWEWRYTVDPARGSGGGSRGKPLAEKRQLLSELIEVLRPASVLDVGCGDGEATVGLPLPNYVGIDLSPEAVRRARSGRPDGDYRVGTLADHNVAADLTICLDVLIHEAEATRYRAFVEELVKSATCALVVSGYEAAPVTNSPMVHFHEPLSKTLMEFAPGAEMYPLRENHGMTTFIVMRGDSPADIGLIVLHRQSGTARTARLPTSMSSARSLLRTAVGRTVHRLRNDSTT